MQLGDCRRPACGMGFVDSTQGFCLTQVCKRFLGRLRRECLDQVLALGERHLHRVIIEYVQFFKQPRPHQGMEHKIPAGITTTGEEGGERSLRSLCPTDCITINCAWLDSLKTVATNMDEVFGEHRSYSSAVWQNYKKVKKDTCPTRRYISHYCA